MKLNELNIPYFNFLVLPLYGEKVNEILQKIDDGTIHYLKVNSDEWSSVIIQKDTHLFNYKSPLANLDDIDDIQEIPDDADIHTLEDSKTLKKKNDDYFAASNGILVRYDNIIKFIPITYNGTCEIEISDDKKTATATFYPALDGGKQLTENDVVQIIREKNISVKLEMPEISTALACVNNSNEVLDKVIVAKGKEPKIGNDGWTEYLFDTERKTGPIIDENGNCDYYSLNLIEAVTENQKVGIYHPMVEGEDGYDIFNQVIVAPKPKGSKFPKGRNIYYSEEEPTHMLSKIDGYITKVGTEIVVTNLYNIRGDVDFNTGNIVSKGSLNITGNVKNGFNLDMSEKITIGGYVKDSTIIAGGDISIRGGFNGTGKGKIVSGGNVNIRYIRNQTVFSRANITVEKEVVEAKLFAKGDIKNNMLLIGGHSIAGGNIILNSLGHEYGMETKIEVGYDYDILSKIEEITKDLKEMQKELKKLKAHIANNMSDGVVSKLSKALLIKYQMNKKNYDILKKKRENLKKNKTDASGSKVIVSGKIYPGVKIVIDGYKFDVSETMRSKVFYASTEEEGIVVSDR